MLQKKTLSQLKVARNVSKSTDIDTKVIKDIKEPPMVHDNPIDANNVETYQEYIDEPFKVNQNVKSSNENVLSYVDFLEAMVPEASLKQLKKVVDMSKSTDIGNKINTDKTPANSTEGNATKTLDVESYEEYEKEPFKVNQNTKKNN